MGVFCAGFVAGVVFLLIVVGWVTSGPVTVWVVSVDEAGMGDKMVHSVHSSQEGARWEANLVRNPDYRRMGFRNDGAVIVGKQVQK